MCDVVGKNKMNHSKNFINALKRGDIAELKRIPKSDRHNHLPLGGRLDAFRAFYGCNFNEPPEFFKDFSEFDEYILVHLSEPLLKKPMKEWGPEVNFFIRSALETASKDGIVLLEGSLTANLLQAYANIEEFEKQISTIQKEVAPHIDLRLELGIIRNVPVEDQLYYAEMGIESGLFYSIDLYGDERIGDIESFKPLFIKAKKKGLVCKAHAGELIKDPEFVRKSVEMLNLDAVQHGIAAAGSKEVMKWLAQKGTMLNICPTSNVRLRNAENLKTHPIRILFDNGVKCSVNSDDITVFNSTVTDEFLALYNAGTFSAEELDLLRINGLEGLPESL